MKSQSYNYMSFRHRLQTSARLLSRARKQGVGQVMGVWLQRQPSLLASSRPLDGLSLYRQAVSKLQVPKALYADRGKTILLVSHC